MRKSFDNGGITSFTLATNDAYVHEGKVHKRVDWHRVSTSDEKLGNVIEKILKKGSRVYVEGQLRTRNYTDKQGVDRTSTEIVINRRKGILL